VSDRIDIKTPDGRLFSFPNSELGRFEAAQFVDGWCRALECYGIWKDGRRYIGSQLHDIRDLMRDMRNQLHEQEAAK
jgi:hypothetical protein